ncbi:MAG: hypothetical protein U0637_11600 [Phycisphaerales bacterium]
MSVRVNGLAVGRSAKVLVAGNAAAVLALLACAGQAAAQTFTGAAEPTLQTPPYNWYASLQTGTVCGGPNDRVVINNWGQSWCSSGSPFWPSGTVNLNGFDVANFADTAVAGVINPAGGLLRIGLGNQSFGNVSNAGTIAIGRGAGGNAIYATTIANTGTLSNSGGGGGTGVGNLTINNSGIVTNSTGSFDMSVTPGQPWSGPCVLNSTGVIESVSNGSSSGNGNLVGWTVNVNAGSVSVQNNCSLNFPGCAITSQPAATWSIAGGTSNIYDSSLQGTFNGTTSGGNGIIFNGAVSFPENTTFNVGGNGVYRWVGPTFTIAPGKTLTNAGRMWAIAPHTHPTIGNFTNTGTFEHLGTIQLNNSTYTNTAGGTYNLHEGQFTAIGPNQVVNNGLMHTPDQNGSGTTFSGVNFANTGVVRNDGAAGSTVRFMAGTSIVSTPGAQWLTPTASNGMDFNDVTMQGTFNGSNPGTTVRMNGTITFPEDTTFNIGGNGIYRWVGPVFNIAPGKTVTNAGRMWAIGPHSHPTHGSFTNTGTFEHGGNIVLGGSTYTNAAGATYNFYNGTFSATGANQIINNGLMQSTGAGGGMTFQGVHLLHTGALRNDQNPGGSRIAFTGGTSIVSTPGAQWAVTGGGNDGFEFSDASIAGTFNGSTVDTNDWRINGALTVTDDTTLNITGGGLTRWVSSGITVAPGKVLRNTGRMGHLNGGTCSGTIINDGVFEYYNGSTGFAGLSLTNNGTTNWYDQGFSTVSGTNLFANNGTVAVQPGYFNLGVNVPVMNNGLIRIGDQAGPAGWGSNFNTLQQGPAGVVRLVAPADPTSILYVPAGSLLNGGTIEGNGAVSIDNLQGATFGNVLINANDRAAGSGRLQLRGYATLSPSTRTRVRIDGPGAATSIECWRTLACAGTLELDFQSGFTPAVGTSWTVAGAQTRTGTFASVVVVGGNTGIQVSTSYTATTVVVTVTDAGCDSIDFNGDTLFPDTQDIEDFLTVFSGGPCSNEPHCGDIDFNNDGLLPDTADIDAILRVFSGGPCL